MISEQDKQAILNGSYGITRNGHKVRFIGYSTKESLELTFVTLPKDKIHYYTSFENINIIFVNKDSFKAIPSTGEDHNNDIVGLYVDKPEPFNLERALQGDPVRLRNGHKAYVKGKFPEDYTGEFPIYGYQIHLHGDINYELEEWTEDGHYLEDEDNEYDIVSMWKDPEPVSKNVTVTLPRALKKPHNNMWFIDAYRVTKSSNDKNISADDFARIPYFGSESDANAWLKAMLDSRGI